MQRKKNNPKKPTEISKTTNEKEHSTSISKSKSSHILLYLAGLVVMTVILIFVGHHALQILDTNNDPPGELISVGFFGQKLHIFCVNSDKTTNDYGVIFHHGLLGSFVDWYSLQHKLGEMGIASCSYDRPGFGFSPLPQTNDPASIEESVKNLHELLQASHIKSGKNIHVGHSLGGAFALGYAHTYPSEVSTVVLLDPLLWISRPNLDTYKSSISWFNILTKLGLNRILTYLNFFKGITIPHGYSQQLTQKFTSQDKFVSAVMWELESLPQMTKFVQNLQSNQLPVTLVSSTQSIHGFSVLTPEVLSFHFDPNIKTILIKNNYQLTEYNSSDPHLQLPYSDIILKILTTTMTV